MTDKITVQFVAAIGGNAIGSTKELERTDAKRLIRAGAAVPATVPAAKKAGVAPDEAATKR